MWACYLPLIKICLYYFFFYPSRVDNGFNWDERMHHKSGHKLKFRKWTEKVVITFSCLHCGTLFLRQHSEKVFVNVNKNFISCAACAFWSYWVPFLTRFYKWYSFSQISSWLQQSSGKLTELTVLCFSLVVYFSSLPQKYQMCHIIPVAINVPSTTSFPAEICDHI